MPNHVNQPKTKKQLLLEKALHLFVDQGIYATSSVSIAKGAGVANGNLFRHFPYKDILVLELYKDIKRNLAMKIPHLERNATTLQKQKK